MPANVIKLEEVVPGLNGTTFEAPDGKTYHVPGDLPTETVFNMLALFGDLTEFEQQASEEMAKNASTASIKKVRDRLKAVTDRINEELLAIFRLSDPSLEKVEFGSRTTAVVLGEVFKAMGLGAGGEQGPLPVPPTPPNRKARRASTGKSKTKPSTRTAASQTARKGR